MKRKQLKTLCVECSGFRPKRGDCLYRYVMMDAEGNELPANERTHVLRKPYHVACKLFKEKV